MPAVNVQMSLFKRAMKNDVDLPEVLNKYLESYLDELENTEG